MAVQVAYRLTLDAQQVRKLVTANGGPVWEAVARGSRAGVNYAKIDLTVNQIGDTGQLRNQIEYNVALRGDDIVGRVTSRAAHTMYVHEGTRSPIVRRTARALRFTVRGSGVVFATSVRGTRETGRWTPFMRNALEQLSPHDLL